MQNKILAFIRQKPYLAFILIWGFFQIAWLGSLGFHFDLEAVKYIDEADFILSNHTLSQGRYLFYITTVIVIAIAKLMHIGLHGAVVLVMLVNLSAYLLFLKGLIKLYHGNVFVPLIIALFLVGCAPYQSWTCFLYSEAMFYSAALMLLGHLMLFEKIDFKFFLITAMLLLFVIVSRPLGILFVLPVLLFVYFHLTQKQKLFFYVFVILGLVLLNYVVQIVFTTTPDWNMQKTMLEESLICDVPGVTMPAQLDIIQSDNKLYQLLYYITHNPMHFFRLAALRLKLFFTLGREYFSAAHNLYLYGYAALLYIGIIIGWGKIKAFFSKSLLVFLVSSIVLFAMAIALQCDDWHNRFYMTLMPVFTMLSAIGFIPKKYLGQ